MTDLKELFTHRPPAVVTMELQRGVVGVGRGIPALVQAVEANGVLGACARLVGAAREGGVPVVHARVAWRADRAGTPGNSPLLRSLRAVPGHMTEGTDAVELVPELTPHPDDLHSVRQHGLTPFTGTDLDAILRSAGVGTIVPCGVSLNIGILGLCLEAVGLGYDIVLPTDATVGVPPTYGDEVVAHSLRPVAVISSVDQLVAAWA